MNRLTRLALLPLVAALSVVSRADDAPAVPSADPASLRADNKQLTDELAAAWKEADKLKADLAAAQAASAKSTSDATDLKTQLDAAKALAAAPTPASVDTSSQLGDTQDKLATALRSFSVLQDANTGLHASVDKLTADNAGLTQQLSDAKASIATLQVQAAATAQIDPLRTQLRQEQDEAVRLSTENEQLRNRLALSAPGPGGLKPAPTRPGAAETLVPEPVAAPAPAPAAPEAKTYVVAEGDTLTKISRKFYGTSNRWPDILQANHGVLKNEKSLVVGSTIKIP
jgi:nucleoid-associated protein YgaU